MKTYIKLSLIVFVFACFTSSHAQKTIKGGSLCSSLEINGPDALDSFDSNITYSVISSFGPLPSGYNYQWTTSGSALQIISGNGTSSVTVNYTTGEVELFVSIIKDASSASCCLSKVITQADVPVVPPFRTIIVPFSSCPTAFGAEPDCTQNILTWELQLVDANGNPVGNTANPVNWLGSGNILGFPTTIDSITSQSGANMTGNNNDCYSFTVVCEYGGYYYYGSFRTPSSGTSETCNSNLAYDSGYYTGNQSSGYTKTQTGWRQTLIDNGTIN